ncbi:O-antigen chain-terminating methyltransferase [Duganella sp. CF402]|uniref:class I SAM-dependent methyltransferase n=1 Tax=unclassified Duganella TaxID=2636909 RepID=UPI0008AB957C|nr:MULTISPECIES: class I SAM-dependent methyltransferase [unclassified Duganella]RZT08684.1 O-antigen chain-terminating methyltransferase [Duganella sp. BK701]SEL85504.1 O-antigen chain-terminating methyltransferase [Duganella sp. CF402]
MNSAMHPSFYRAFEDRYRGSRETITGRLRAYQPFVAPLLDDGPAAALDLGCGRGEWLELLGEYGLAARGIDLDDGMLAACRERGLQVETQDALAALRAAPDNSLALVSAFHLVEHIPFDMVRELIAEALRALRPGGLLILETPNPENLVVGASSFYMDPSHLRPIPPLLLAFAAEHAGFARHKIVRLQEEAQLHTDARIGMINVLEGPSPDYSVVAQKAAPDEEMAALDAAFATDYGIALAPLAQRYDLQLAKENGELHRALGRHAERLAEQQVQTRAEHADSAQRLQQLEQRLNETQHHLHQASLLLQQTTQKADAMGRLANELLASTSWRITAPLRAAVTFAHRVRGWGKRKVRGAVLAGGRWVLRHPRIKRVLRAVLTALAPRLQARLMRSMLQASAVTPVPLRQDDAPGQLSPRATRAYHELTRAAQQAASKE